MTKIITYLPEHQDSIAELITTIQQKEFGVPITLQDQPDLLDIDNFYRQKNGNFWCAVNEKSEVVGTIALIDVGESFGTIRKMFVKADYRGKETGVAAALINVLETWAKEHNMTSLYLGTFDRLKASHRFYEKNDFARIEPEGLPTKFPRMRVDNVFYRKNF